MTPQQEPQLFISGAGLPSWIWDDTRLALRSTHEAVVATRPTRDDASLSDYANAALESAPWKQFAVVAHSIGGTISAEMLRIAPERISAFLAVSAVIPKPGASFVTAMPFPNRLILGAAMKFAGTRPPESRIRKGLASGVDSETAERIVREFQPESKPLYRDKTGERQLPERRGFLFTSQDKEIPLNMQRRFAQNLALGWEDSMSTGHLPMLESPAEFARIVDRFITGE